MTGIALLGFGNVGRGFARYLLHAPPDRKSLPVIRAVADVSGGLVLHSPDRLAAVVRMMDAGMQVKDCGAHGRLLAVAQYVRALAGSGVSVLLECMPTNIVDGQPALGYLQDALRAGIHVVTVDKGPVVHGFSALLRAAGDAGARLAYGGTSGVRPPPGIQAGQISEICGILNGTTNFILTEMLERSLPFSDALALAQARGIAEPNPSLDIEGWDTACKILILAQEYMGARTRLGDIPRQGLGPEVDQLIGSARIAGSAVRLIGRASEASGRLALSVAPELVDPDSPFFGISGVRKGAFFRTRQGASLYAEGFSGRDSLSCVILDDIAAVSA